MPATKPQPAPSVDALVQAPVAPPVATAPAPTPTIAGPAPVESAAAPDAAPAEQLPSLAALDSGTRESLPPMRMSMHVYNAEAGRRFSIPFRGDTTDEAFRASV